MIGKWVQQTRRTRQFLLALLLLTALFGSAPVIHAAIPNDCDRWIAEYKHFLLEKAALRKLNAARHRAQLKLTGIVHHPHPHLQRVSAPRPHRIGPLEALRRFQLQCDIGPPAPQPTYSTPVSSLLPPRPNTPTDLVFDTEVPVFDIPAQPTPTTPGGESPATPIYFGGSPGAPPVGVLPPSTPSPVPEPATWIYVLTGIFLAGWSLRSGRSYALNADRTL